MGKVGSVAVVAAVMLALVGASGAARGPEKAPKEDKAAVPGELIVGFAAGVSEAGREDALARADFKEKKKLTRGGRIKLAHGNPARLEHALKKLADDPRVAYAEPNYVVRVFGTPNDPSFGELWGLDNTGQTVDGATGVADADIDADLAWDVTTGSSSVTVGVIDTGVDFSHPDLAGTSWINAGEDCTGCRTNGVDDDGNGYVDDWRGWDFVNEDNDPFDDHGHGTHVSGTIGGIGNNGVGIAGVNWNVRIMALKFLDGYGSGTLADAIRAIDYATANGALITNNSWGGGGYSQALLDSIERAGAAGGLFVAAAGNDGSDNDAVPAYPASYESTAILSVAATDSSDRLATFSNWGKETVDLGAPGVSIYSAIPGGGYDWWSGTSMATPHVAGAAALAKAHFADATGAGLKALLLRTVDPVAALANTTTGGRLNVNNAVRCSGAQVWIEQPVEGFVAVIGDPLHVTAIGTNCSEPAGTVTATANGVAFSLVHQGDGRWTGTLSPASEGPLTITVTATVDSATDSRSVSGTVRKDYLVSEEPFAWIDATSGGTNTGLRADDGSVTLTLPFEFPYYDATYTSVKVSSNGYLVFGGSAAGSWQNTAFPDTAEPNGVVAPFWDDLSLANRGALWYRTVGTAPERRFVVSWIDVPHYYDVGDSTFQVVLDEATGAIVFQYRDVDFGDTFVNDGASATVGVESVDGLRGRTVFYNEAELDAYSNAKAIRLTYGAPAAPSEPDTTPPAAPTALAATAGEDSVALDWADNSESDVASYRVYRDGVHLASPTASAYTDSGLTAGVTYSYTVTAVDASGNESEPSSAAGATPTGDVTAPATPTGLVATAKDAAVALDWADNTDADLAGYRVYRDGLAVATVTASAYVDSGLANGVTYAYRVSAIDEVPNESAASAEVSATPVAVQTRSYAPSSYSIVRGSLYSGSLASLASDDGDFFTVRSAKKRGWHWADYYASATISEPRSSLLELKVDFSGRATSNDAWIDFYVYDWVAGQWEWVDGSMDWASERQATWTTTTPARYVSSSGQVTFRVAADNGSAFRTQTDLIRFSIKH